MKQNFFFFPFFYWQAFSMVFAGSPKQQVKAIQYAANCKCNNTFLFFFF